MGKQRGIVFTYNNEGIGLCGMGIMGYRCFTSDSYAKFGPFNKIQLFTGQNNSGKSTLMLFAVKLLNAIREDGTISGEGLDIELEDIHFEVAEQKELRFTLCFDWESLLFPTPCLEVERQERLLKTLFALLDCMTEEHGGKKYVWLNCKVGLRSTFKSSCHDIQFELPCNLEELMSVEDFEEMAIWLTSGKVLNPIANSLSSNEIHRLFSKVIRRVVPWGRIPKTELVQAIRHVSNRPQSGESAITRGNGLIGELHKLSNPNPRTQDEADKKWKRFTSFARCVLCDSSAEIKIDAEETVVMVKTRGSSFYALSDLGTGIEELIMLAAAVAVSENKLICIEEPELHLHPALQMDLIYHLNEDTAGNRFLITTHSATLVNSGFAEVAQIVKDDNGSHSIPVRSFLDSRRVVDDLGIRPADLLMANYVVWVEGPSDRIYIRNWIFKIDPSLKEGRHYAVMFYGGRLLSNLTISGVEAPDDLINLIKINTHCCIIMDSDRDKKGGKINQAKQRLRKECEGSGCFVWVTDYYTIENYVPEELLADALKELYPKKIWSNPLGNRYRGPLSGCFDGSTTVPDKKAVARWVTNAGFEMDQVLNKHVNKLVEAIRRANGIHSNLNE